MKCTSDRFLFSKLTLTWHTHAFVLVLQELDATDVTVSVYISLP